MKSMLYIGMAIMLFSFMGLAGIICIVGLLMRSPPARSFSPYAIPYIPFHQCKRASTATSNLE
jgi:hypothetical protein